MAVRLGWIGTYVTTQHPATDDVVGPGVIPIVHDQHLWLTEARLTIDAGLTERFGASVMLPYRVVSTSIRYLDGSGMPVDLVTPNTHHRNETLHGIGDPWLLGSAAFSAGDVRLTARAGVSVPLGRTEKDPFAMPDLPHEHIQMGNGTFNPIAALEAAYGWSKWRVAAYAFTQQVVYANSKGYQAGDRYALGAHLHRELGRFGVQGGLEMMAETHERWHGITNNEEGNQGRIDAMFAAGASVAAGAGFTIDVSVKIPFVTHVVGGQLDMPALVEVGVGRLFGEEHHHHHHDHDVEPPPGVGPVPGKMTVIDYWATWCEPCKRVSPVLDELEKKHPDTLVVRRIDVSNEATDFDLPHVTIYDASGTRVFDKSSSSGGLVPMLEEIQRIVDGKPAAAPQPPPVATPGARRIDITADDHGFTPAKLEVTHGEPIVLRFRRTSDNTCATEVSLDHDGEHVLRELPLGKDVDVPITFTTPGTVTFSCAMNMFKGTIEVR